MITLEITIQRQTNDGYPIVTKQVRSSGMLPVYGNGLLLLDEAALVSQPNALAYGQVLGQAFFKDDIRDAFTRALVESDDALRLLLFIEAPELRTWHWERLCAPVDGQWSSLALNQRVYFTLHLPSHTDRRFPPIGRRDLQALVVVANPDGLDRYGLVNFDDVKTVASVKQALGTIPVDVLAASDIEGSMGPPSLEAIVERLMAQPYTLLHLVAHGRFVRRSGDTVIYLADKDNQVVPVPTSQLIERLANLGGQYSLPHYTFLCTCESAKPDAEGALGGLGQRLVRELGMPAVIAMTDNISIDTAGILASNFYQYLRQHGEVDRALNQSFMAIANQHDLTVPALYSRLGGKPLFSDSLDRLLTNKEIKYGLERVPILLQERAPILLPQFEVQVAPLLGTLDMTEAALSKDMRQKRQQILLDLATLCEEAIDLNFHALALDQPPPPYDARCPFVGLYAFRGSNKEFFFGREKLVADLVRKIKAQNFLAVLGPSGSGKSSVIFAGLVPALQLQNPYLHLLRITPGNAPVQTLQTLEEAVIFNQSSSLQEVSLVRGVKPGKPEFILVVDQFEEIFTLTNDEAERVAFFDKLLTLPKMLKVVITMRADFWGSCANYRQLKEIVQANQELIGVMNTEELRQAMERQAAVVGLEFEANLTSRILDDTAGEPGAMPLLQHALLELWQRRHGRWLKAVEYEAIGGVHRAIAETAEAIYNQLADEEKVTMRNIFLRLTRVDDSEQHRDTRRRVAIDQLIPANRDPQPIRQLIQRLADTRLVVTSVNTNTGQQELEVAHEALIRYWPTLQQWLDESRANLRVSEGVRQAAQTWEEGQKHSDLLQHRGSQLEQATELLASPYFAVNELEAQYIKACEALQTRLIEEKEQQRQREIQYFRRMATMSIAGFVIMLILAIGVFYSRQTAIENNRKAVMAEAKAKDASQVSRARELATKADSLTSSPQQSLLLAVKSLQTAPDGVIIASAEESLWKTLNQAGGIALTGHLATINAVAVSHNGACAITSDDNGVIGVWSLTEISKLLPTITASPLTQADLPPPQFIYSQQGSILSTVVNQEASWFITGGLNGSLWLWDLDQKQGAGSMAPQQARYYPLGQPLNGPIYSLKISPDKCWLASGNGDKSARLWSLCRTPDHPITEAKELAEWLNHHMTPNYVLRGHTEEVLDVAFSPTQHWLASGSRDNTTRIWDLSTILTMPFSATQALISHVALEEETMIFAVGFSMDEHTLFTVGGTPPWVSNNTHDGQLYFHNIDFLKDVTLGDSKIVSVQDTNLLVNQAGEDHLTDLLVIPDKQILIGSNWDGSIFMWDAQNMYAPIQQLFGPESYITHMALWGNDGFLTVGGDKNLRIWNLHHPNAAPVIFSDHLAWVNNVALSQDNQWVVTGSEDGFVRLWNLNYFNALPLQLDNHQASIHALVLSPDNHWLATGSDDKTIQLWQFPPQPLLTGTVNFSDVNQLDAAYSLSQPIMLGGNQAPIRNLLISGDNHWLVSNSNDGVVWRWDLHKPQAGGVRLPSTGQDVLVMAINQQGNGLVTGHKGGTAYLWDLNNPVAPKYVLSGHTDDVSAIAISSSGRWVATGSEDSTMQLWDLGNLTTATLPEPQVFTHHTDGILTIAMSPDEHWLATGGWEGYVGVIDLTNLQTPPRIFHDHTGWVNVLAISPNNHWLISGSYDETMNVWDLNSPQDRAVTLSSHEGRITSLAISADSSLFISGSSDRTARLWLLKHDELLKQACHTAGRELTAKEKLLFLDHEEAAMPICAEYK